MKYFYTKNNAFTLIELLTVIAIIGFISVIVYANLQDARKRAQETKAVEEINQLSKAFELYKADKGTYPGESDSINIENNDVIKYLGSKLVELKYIPTIPQYGDLNTPNTIYYAYYAGEIVKPDPISRKNTECGSKIINDYIFIFETDRSILDLNLPRVPLEEGSVVSGYCIGQ
jgi:prepilin-type N-terminal cleavage/methylation domain-containing protein